tara:strand:+ start:470 stop:1165 length:696 start_codon:yes stop_codon:yes gene_type:complete
MPSKSGNLYGMLFLTLLSITILSIITSEQQATGFAVQRTECFDGTDFGQCSDTKPRYCDNGALKFNCQTCGCNAGEVCQSDGSCVLKCEDGTPFGHCSEKKPLLCFKGDLVANCFECGCFPGQTCSDDGACIGKIEVGAGEEKEEVIEEVIVECSDGSSYGQCSASRPKYCDNGNLVDNCGVCGCNEGSVCNSGACFKKSDAGFWWNLFCNMFYFNEHDDCIADAIRHKNK